MNFDGAACREGARAGIWINHPKGDSKLCSYKVVFECTNNMAKYEALILGLKVLEELGAKRIVVHGDSEIIINKIKGIYQEKHPRLRAYRNMVLDLLEKFPECNFQQFQENKIRLLMPWLLQQQFSKFQFSLKKATRLRSSTGQQYQII
jgi:ribonuclease HI